MKRKYFHPNEEISNFKCCISTAAPAQYLQYSVVNPAPTGPGRGHIIKYCWIISWYLYGHKVFFLLLLYFGCTTNQEACSI
jgi:hypothetical protein